MPPQATVPSAFEARNDPRSGLRFNSFSLSKKQQSRTPSRWRTSSSCFVTESQSRNHTALLVVSGRRRWRIECYLCETRSPETVPTAASPVTAPSADGDPRYLNHFMYYTLERHNGQRTQNPSPLIPQASPQVRLHEAKETLGERHWNHSFRGRCHCGGQGALQSNGKGDRIFSKWISRNFSFESQELDWNG